MNTSKPKWREVAPEYEAATLRAINELSHGHNKSQVLTCLRWGDALAEMKTLTDVEYNHARLFLTDRGRLNSEMPNIIRAAVKRFVDEVDKCRAGKPAIYGRCRPRPRKKARQDRRAPVSYGDTGVNKEKSATVSRIRGVIRKRILANSQTTRP
jgi:hypothetical protein